MIRRSPITTQSYRGGPAPATDVLFRNHYRSNDGTAYLARQIEALQRYSYEIPRYTLTGPDGIRWIG
jgi:hypothetical protein